MDPDGKHPSIIAQGLRNAVDIGAVSALGGSLFATNMGDDHLGDKLLGRYLLRTENRGEASSHITAGPRAISHQASPCSIEPSLPTLGDARANALTASVPASHSSGTSVYGNQDGVAAFGGTNLSAGGGHARGHDPNSELGRAPEPLKSCEQVPAAYTTFAAHSSPLGFEYFPSEDEILRGSFLVSLHGASHPDIGTGYRVVQFTPSDRKPHDFITGFLTHENGKAVVHGRPCGILRVGKDSFLLSDDYLGLVYFIHPRG